jgi:type IV pilus assembly protein PilC
MKFEVKVLNNEGVIESKTMEAVSKTVLYEQIRTSGGKLVSAKEITESGLQGIISKINAFIGSVKTEEKIMFARNISAMLSAGLALSRAISIMERQTKNEKFKKVLADVNEEIGKGGTFAGALSKYPKVFSSLFISMVRAGEESGGMSEALSVVSEQMEKSYLLVKKIRGAMIYPSVIVFAMIMIGALMMIYVVPSLTATFRDLNVELPATTKLVISISDFLQNHTILFFLSLFGFVGGVVVAARTERGGKFFDYIFPRFPIIGEIVKEVNSARTARTLASLLEAGVEVVTALSITRDVIQNSYYKDVIKQAEESIQKGAPMSNIFIQHEEIYPILVGEMMAVGEETGALSDMLSKLALFYENEVDRKTKDLSTIIEPFLMLFIGAGVGFFAVAMIQPTYSVLNNI